MKINHSSADEERSNAYKTYNLHDYPTSFDIRWKSFNCEHHFEGNLSAETFKCFTYQFGHKRFMFSDFCELIIEFSLTAL